MRVFVEGVGLYGPGLNGWTASLKLLASEAEWPASPTQEPQPAILPPNERRRAVRTVKLALAAAAEAFAGAGRDPAETASVFASSGGDGETIDQILNVLASPRREISPTRFHNSVHNAPAGYWSIATGARAASVSLCGHDGSFAAGLLEAAAQIATDGGAVALVAYDLGYPLPLRAVRPISSAFAVALVLAPVPTTAAFACLELALAAEPAPSLAPPSLAPPSLVPSHSVAADPPAARSLPLLAALARRAPARVPLAYLDDLGLGINVIPI